MSVLFMFLHVVGYVCTVLLTVGVAVLLRGESRKENHEERLERIARLEIETGVGLDYGREWLLARPIACERGYEKLANDGNGAVRRDCWSCDKRYSPADGSEYGSDWYGRLNDDGRRDLRDRLCAACFHGALTELERL